MSTKKGKVRKLEGGSYYTYLSEGCRICKKGAKLVFFATGECSHSCFYCPISLEKKGKNVVFANERPVKSNADILDELELMSAEGVAVTGGEPLLNERLEEYLELFKSFDLHVHLYTTFALSKERISNLKVDEIRFHPIDLSKSGKFEGSIKQAKKFGIEVGIEIPAISYEQKLVDLLNRNDIFLNLNELEFSSTNVDNLRERGYEIGEFYGDIDSKDIAELYLKEVKNFHYCTSLFKDKAQLRRRLIRMGMNYPEFYQVTEEGTVICGLVEGDDGGAIEILNRSGEGFKILEGGGGIETSPYFVEKEGEKLKALGCRVSIIERYPTWKRIVVEKIPL